MQVGNLVVIEESDYALKRYPDSIGKEAIIDALPGGPGGNFVLHLRDGQATVKLPAGSFKLLDDGPEGSTTGDTPDTRSEDSYRSSPTVPLRQGMRVVILGTNNAIQRAAHLVDEVGTLKEVPMHPATWYKVEFGDGTVATFRPSALQPVDPEGQPMFPLPKRKVEKVEPKVENVVEPPVCRSSGRNSPAAVRLLSTTDPDSWPGRRVRVNSIGRGAGAEGTVRSTGNGWVQVELDGSEVLAKRAYELDIADDCSPSVPARKRIRSDSKASSEADRPVKRAVPPPPLPVVAEGRVTRGTQIAKVLDAPAAKAPEPKLPDAQAQIVAVPGDPDRLILRAPGFIEARRAHISAYVNKHVPQRPNMRRWEQQLASLYTNPLQEQKAAREFLVSRMSAALSLCH